MKPSDTFRRLVHDSMFQEAINYAKATGINTRTAQIRLDNLNKLVKNKASNQSITQAQKLLAEELKNFT